MQSHSLTGIGLGILPQLVPLHYLGSQDLREARKLTVPIYYESRLVKLDINRAEIDALNKDLEEVI